jgi:chromosome segregation ATPase
MQKNLSVATQRGAGHGITRELLDLPPTPSFDFADANFIVDIEVHADQLLAYIDKLTSLADRACNTALRQTETAQFLEKNRHDEITSLRSQLESKSAQCHEQQLALIRLEEESKAQIAVLQSQLHLSEVRQQQAEKDQEVRMLRIEKAGLASRVAELEAVSNRARPQKEAQLSMSIQEVADLKLQPTKRDEATHRTNDAIKKIEANLNTKIKELTQALSEVQAELQTKDAKLKEQEAIIQATAAKEAGMGNLIKRLSAECSSVNTELQEKTRMLARIEAKMQPISDTKIWRRVIGRLQEEPQ